MTAESGGGTGGVMSEMAKKGEADELVVSGGGEAMSTTTSDYSVSSHTAMLKPGSKERKEDEEEIDDILRRTGIIDDDLAECGVGRCRPACIQVCANIKMFIVICCLLSTTSGALTAGYLSSVITTIEKRFDIGSFVSGLIAASVEVGCIFAVIFVSYFGAKGHIPTWMGVGAVFQGLGAMVFTMPHVTAQPYRLVSTANHSHHVSVCSGGEDGDGVGQEGCVGPTSSNTSYIFMMMLAQLLIGSGGSPLFTLGTTYIDNHVSKNLAPSFIAFIYATGALGPVLGFALGALMLQFYVDFFTIDVDSLKLTPDDPRWVGAWWGGFVICGGVLLLVSVPFFSFPKTLSKETRKLMLEDRSYLQRHVDVGELTGKGEAIPSKYGHDIKELPQAFLRLIRNPVYLITCLGICCEVCIISGFVVFLPKYLETQFSLSKSKANLLTGGVAVPGAVLGVLMGGFLLRRLELSKKGAAQLTLLLNAIALTGYGLFFILGCENIPTAGTNMPYHNQSLAGINLTSSCNADCNCSPNLAEPVCGSDGLTYFSSCHAGCSKVIPAGSYSQQKYTGCGCLSEGLSDVSVSGACPHDCSNLVPFMLMVLVMTFVVSSTQMPLLMITMRSVAEEERAFALGMQFVLLRLLAYIPSPILFGSVIDSSCLFWKTTCSGSRGSCLWYDIVTFRHKFVGIAAALKLAAAAFFVCVWFLVRWKIKEEENSQVAIEMEDEVGKPASVEGVECLGEVELGCTEVHEAPPPVSLPPPASAESRM